MKKFVFFIFLISFFSCATTKIDEFEEVDENIGNENIENDSIENDFFSESIPFVEPESSTLQENAKSAIKIKSSKIGESVFLNGNFQGRTPLTITDLISGIYILQVGSRDKVRIITETSMFDEYFFE